jgi:hypothetical protein
VNDTNDICCNRQADGSELTFHEFYSQGEEHLEIWIVSPGYGDDAYVAE